MKLCRFETADDQTRVGLIVDDQTLLDLSAVGMNRLTPLLEDPGLSARDIEGENLLYLPQAKIYDRSCALGPCIAIGADETEARGWKISIEIRRKDSTVFQGETSAAQIKRSFQELVDYLFRSQTFA